MPTDGPPLVMRATRALEAHAALLRALDVEPARQRDLDDPEVSQRWIRWYDEVLKPAWRERDNAITPLLAHPDWARWHHAVWKDVHTVMFRTPMTWRPVATAILREAPR